MTLQTWSTLQMLFLQPLMQLQQKVLEQMTQLLQSHSQQPHQNLKHNQLFQQLPWQQQQTQTLTQQ